MNIVTGYAGKAHITSDRVRNFNASIVGTGKYVMDLGAKFGYEIISNNLIRINNGHLVNQGTHACIDINDYEEMVIDNGLQGVNRNDLIVAKYEKNVITGIENVSMQVIKGTSGAVAVDPEYVSGDILQGAAEDDMLMYRVRIEGLSIVAVEPLFEMFENATMLVASLKDEMIELINQAAKLWMIPEDYTVDCYGVENPTKETVGNVFLNVKTGQIFMVVSNEWTVMHECTSVEEEINTINSNLTSKIVPNYSQKQIYTATNYGNTLTKTAPSDGHVMGTYNNGSGSELMLTVQIAINDTDIYGYAVGSKTQKGVAVSTPMFPVKAGDVITVSGNNQSYCTAQLYFIPYYS